MFQNIPNELKVIPAWIVWKYEDIGARKPTKVPYDAKTNQLASVDNPSTWSDFNTVCSISTAYSGIGFVFSDNDPFSFIDLDDGEGDINVLNRQIKIFHEFDSYSEVSPSGKGLHIIVRGTVPNGRRRSFIEVYSNKRYATFTGQIYNDKPIQERSELLLQLWAQMGSGAPATFLSQGSQFQKYTDREVYDQAINAVNGEKFNALFEGRWVNLYPTQSEADFAFINIISFYSQHKQQIKRLFRMSQLGKRVKANRDDYLEKMILRSFDNILPKVDIEGFNVEIEKKLEEIIVPSTSVAQLVEPAAHNGSDVGSNPTASPISIPPGLVGEIAQFIYRAAPRPVPEIALAAALGLMAGICGRAYNVSSTGLNQYILLIARTGTGKEAMASGIDRLMNTIRLMVPTSTNFIGPSEIASGQALVKYLNKTSNCFLSILGEFGLRLETMSSPHANSSEKHLLRMLLDLFNKSGHGQQFRPSIFADDHKNITLTDAPAFSILGESTPDRFYGALNESMIGEGLLPRFSIIEYNGLRPKINEFHATSYPSIQLTEQFAGLVSQVEQIMHAKRVINVAQSPDALELTNKFNEYVDKLMNVNINNEIMLHLWSRAHIKVLKLSALIAVGVNMSDPLIVPEYVHWSIDMVQNDIRALSEKFETGMVGQNNSEVKQAYEITKVIKDFMVSDFEKAKKYLQGKNVDLLFKHKIIPYTYFSRKLTGSAAYRTDKNGATFALKRAIQVLIESDKLRELDKQTLAAKYGTTQRAFMVSDMKLLD